MALRKHEYYANTGRSLFGRIMKKFWGAVHEIYGVRLGFSIPINVFGPGLRINHYGLIGRQSEGARRRLLRHSSGR